MEKKKDNRKKIAPLALVLLFIGVISVVGGTYAWFTNSQSKTNNFTLGEIKHEIIENFNSQGPAEDILPGELVNKDVWIHNLGKSDALLRVKVTPLWIDSNGQSSEVTNNDVIINFVNDLNTNWQKGTDGYYYYKKVLPAHNGTVAHPVLNTVNGSSVPTCYSAQLVDSITLNNAITDQTTYANRRFDVMVVSETIQVNMDACKSEWNVSADKSLETMLQGVVDGYKTSKGKIQP
ncbi:MAG: BsaA family SipW-dependent biofilm matrix protein [Sarcina sp.]